MTPGAMSETALRYAGLTLLHASVLAMLTWMVCRALRARLRPTGCAVLWTIVLLKFALPPVLPGELTLSAWLARSSVAQGLTLDAEAPVDPGWDAGLEGTRVTGAASGSVAAAARSRASDDPFWPILLGAAYLLGLFLVAGRWLARRAEMARIVRELSPASDALVDEVRGLGHRLGLLSIPAVRTTASAMSPFISGFWTPTLVLPKDLLSLMNRVEREALILHELAHLRRGDLLIRGLENVLRAVFYFWPPVGWVCRQIERYSEMACDQWAVLAARVSPEAYADALLKVVRHCAGRQVPAGVALAFARRGWLLEERFHMILEQDCKKLKYSWFGTAALIAWAAFGLAGGAAAQDHPEKDKPSDAAPAQVRPTGRPAIDMDQPVPAERAKALFEQYGEEGIDANGDGALTRREVFEFYRKKGLPFPGRPGPEGAPGDAPGAGRFGQGRGGPGGPMEMLDLFERFLRIESGRIARERILNAQPRADLDQDGKLSDEEFAKALDFARGMAVKRLMQAVPAADKDGNGELSEEELAAFKATTLERLGQRILAANKQADADGDGKLSEDEFLAFREAQAVRLRQELLERHPETDTDKDGKLSDEEFRAAEQKLRPAAGRGRPQSGQAGPPRPLPGELKKDAPEGHEPAPPKP